MAVTWVGRVVATLTSRLHGAEARDGEVGRDSLVTEAGVWWDEVGRDVRGTLGRVSRHVHHLDGSRLVAAVSPYRCF